MTLQEIITKHKIVDDNLNTFFASLSQEQFTESINDGWSPAEHIAHLIIGNKIIAKALSIPKTMLALRFGKAAKDRKTDSYSNLTNNYKTALSTGFKAPKEFVPKEDKMIWEKDEALNTLQISSARFVESLNKWDDTTIDSYLLPHPALKKKISIREMLYFELFHSLHHRNNVAKDLGFAESWPL